MSNSYLTIEFLNLQGDAFSSDNMGPEIARILRKVANAFDELGRQELVDDDYPTSLVDINGNKVGSIDAYFYPDDDDEQAKFDAVREITKWMERSDIVIFLADHCSIQVHDSEDADALVEAIVQAIDDGDCTLDDLKEFDRKS